MIDIDIEKIKAAALDALDELDDCARMECSVEAIGAMNHLTNFVQTVCDRLESAEKDAARYRFIDDTAGYAACAYIKGIGWSPSNTYEIDEAMKEKP